jgi:hypothetical protein
MPIRHKVALTRALVIGIIAAFAAFVGFGLVSIGFYASPGGLLIAGGISLTLGAVAGALVRFGFPGDYPTRE